MLAKSASVAQKGLIFDVDAPFMNKFCGEKNQHIYNHKLLNFKSVQ